MIRWSAIALLLTLAIASAEPSSEKSTAASAARPKDPVPSASASAPPPSNEGATRRRETPLPKPPSLELPPPDPSTLQDLDALLSRLAARDSAVRETAAQEILETERDWLPAIHRRLASLAESADRQDMKDLLGAIRDKERETARKRKDEGDDEKGSGVDYLQMLLSHARPESRAYRDLVSVIAMSRMLRQIATVGACRELVGIHARFGEFLRVDTQRQLAGLGDRSVAALIEATRHQAPKIATWASRQLDALGKAIPSEAVQTSDPEVLADILRAFGRARDPDAARLIISFANSERTQIRDAARQAVVLLGEVANWQLRDTYENVVGKKPLREWSWDRTARELFSEFDRLRLAQVDVLFEKGLAAERAGKVDEMAQAFDDVLTQNPMFDRGREMVPGYLAFAHAHLDDAPEKAVNALHRVERLCQAAAPECRIGQSLLLTLEAERLLAGHVADPVLLQRALEIDPNNGRARRLAERIERGDRGAESRLRRYVGAGAILAAALVAIGFLLLKRRPA